MSSLCFVTQEATSEILSRVTSVCAECYDELQKGDIIHYDMEHYRYLCVSCQESWTASHQKDEAIEEEGAILF